MHCKVGFPMYTIDRALKAISLKFTIQGTLRFDEGLLHQQQNGKRDMISENENSALKTVYKYM